MSRRYFWLANAALLLLYIWTLAEEARVTIRVAGGVCTAVFPERSLSIPCPGLDGGEVGLYLTASPPIPGVDFGPLDWLAPHTAWRSATFTPLSGDGPAVAVAVAADPPGWRRVLDEWRPTWEGAVIRWPVPLDGEYALTVTVRRPEDAAGILLLQPGGENGWLFVASGRERQGVWWHWENGRPAEPIAGIPWQKSFLAQTQSLLRRLLRAHQGALLLLLAGWLAAKGMSRLRFPSNQLFRRRFALSERAFMLAAALTALLVTGWIAWDVLDGIPHVQDSITYLFQAQTLARGRLWAPAPTFPRFFEQEFLLMRDGRWFGKYPPGYPLLLAVGVWLRRPWLVNPVLAALTVPLLYALGRELYGRASGRLAVALLLPSPFFLFMSGSMMAHAAELFWMGLFMWAWVRATKAVDGRRWAALAGAAWGMTFLTRQVTAVALGVTFAVLMAWRGRKWDSSIAVPQIATSFAFALPFILALFATQTAVTGRPFTDPRLLYWAYDRLGFGYDIGMGANAFHLTETGAGTVVDWYHDPTQPPRGHTPARGIYNTEQNWRALEITLFGWPPLFALAFVWLAFLLRRPSRADMALLLSAAALVMVYVFYWASGIMYGPRYYYAALPSFLLLTVRGIEAAGEWLNGRTADRHAITGLVALLVAGNLALNLPQQVTAHRGYNFISGEPLAQVERAIHGRGIVFVHNDEVNWWEYGCFFSGNTPWLDGRLLFARDLGEEENGRLLAFYPGYQAYQWRNGRLTGPMAGQ